MKAVSEWVWIIGGVIAGLIIFSVAQFQIYQLNLATTEQRSLEQFREMINIINNLCWSFAGNVREYKLTLSKTIDGIYAALDKYTELEKDELKERIREERISGGNWLCIKISNKRLRCEELECNVTMPFIGSVPVEFSLSALINKLLGKGEIFEYELRLERGEDFVNITRTH